MPGLSCCSAQASGMHSVELGALRFGDASERLGVDGHAFRTLLNFEPDSLDLIWTTWFSSLR